MERLFEPLILENEVKRDNTHFIVLTLCVSFLLHLYFLSNTSSHTSSPLTSNSPFKITIKNHEQSSLSDASLIRTEKNEETDNTIQPAPEALISQTKSSQTTTIKQNQTIQKSETNESIKKKNSSFSSSTIINSTLDVISKQNKEAQERWIENCNFNTPEFLKKNCKNTYTSSASKRADPYGLASIFDRSFKQSSNKQQDAYVAKMLSDKQKIQAALDSKTLDAQTERYFKEELAFLRQEVIINDCGGPRGTGRCSGEIPLGKIVELLQLLFK